jgi:Mn-dependent DtxR family transcriptional regulator
MTLNVYEQAIIRLMKIARRPLTTTQIAEKLRISWETAKKYLETLHNKRYISMHHEGNRIYWRIK